MKVTGKFLALAPMSWAALGKLSSAQPVNALKELSCAKSVSMCVCVQSFLFAFCPG